MTRQVDLERQRPAEPVGGLTSPPGPGRRLLVGGVAVAVAGLLALLGYGLVREAGGAGIAVNAKGQVGRIRPGPRLRPPAV